MLKVPKLNIMIYDTSKAYAAISCKIMAKFITAMKNSD